MKTRLLFSVLLFSVMVSFGQSWMYTDLTEAKLRMGSASLGTKAYFVGGDNIDEDSDLVEIYDVTDESWSYENLSQARSFPVGISCGSKVLFAGGWIGANNVSDVVDIYDTVTQEWTVGTLSEPRFLISAVAHGDKVFFAGGLNLGTFTASDAVDIYDVETGEWSTDSLSMGRFAMGAAVLGDVAIFAGGDNLESYTDRVDKYNFTTDTWTTDALVMERAYIAAVTVNEKILIAGGMTIRNDPNSASNLVEIYDNSTGGWSFMELPHARAFMDYAKTIGNKVYFVGGGNFDGAGGGWATSVNFIDIYDNATGEWSVDYLTHDLINHSVAAIETPQAWYLLAAGGASLQQELIFSTVEILWDFLDGIEDPAGVQSSKFKVQSYPNPFSNFITIEYELEHPATVNLAIYNHLGQRVALLVDEMQASGRQQVRWDAEGMPAGVYNCRMSIADGRLSRCGKIVKY